MALRLFSSIQNQSNKTYEEENVNEVYVQKLHRGSIHEQIVHL